jgi:hypothetical protein
LCALHPIEALLVHVGVYAIPLGCSLGMFVPVLRGRDGPAPLLDGSILVPVLGDGPALDCSIRGLVYTVDGLVSQELVLIPR